jgi:glycine betaine transporter
MSVQHILVPVDFSPYSDQAITYAMALAGKLQARVTLLHVIHEIPIGVGDMATALPYSYMQELEAEVQRSLEEQLKGVQRAGIRGDIMVLHGVPFQTIVDVAREQQIDLIIMGTHGRTGLSHVLLGSVAEKVVRLAHCPVLVTRKEA